MDAEALRRTRVAVLGLDTTSGDRPLITGVAVLYVDDGVISAGPFAYRATDAPSSPPKVAERVRLALRGRVLVTHDAERLDLLRRHLPAWEPPAGVAHTRDLVEQAWPGKPDYGLSAASALAGINGVARVGPSAAVEAHTVAFLLTVLIRRAARTTTKARNGHST
jgi:hypothetical protein